MAEPVEITPDRRVLEAEVLGVILEQVGRAAHITAQVPQARAEAAVAVVEQMVVISILVLVAVALVFTAKAAAVREEPFLMAAAAALADQRVHQPLPAQTRRVLGVDFMVGVAEAAVEALRAIPWVEDRVPLARFVLLAPAVHDSSHLLA